MKIWYSYKGVPYTGDCPPFYNLSSKSWFKKLQEELPIIQHKTKLYLQIAEEKIHSYFNNDIVEGMSTWDVSTFMFWGNNYQENLPSRNAFFEHFSSIPGIASVSISILSPQTVIKPHFGDTDAVYRLHVPINIPSTLPECGLMVNGISKSWNSNEIICFCDGHLHQAWNNTNEQRTILIVDIVREELLHRKKSICNNVLSLIQLQKLLLKNRKLNLLPSYCKGVLRYFFKLKIYLSTMLLKH